MSFKRFEEEDIVVSAESIAGPVWSNNEIQLTSFVTSSTQENGTTGRYYLQVYQTASTDQTAAVQFSVAYGHKDGSGSLYYNADVPSKSPTSTIYGQYRNLVLGDEEAEFTFGGVTSKHFYAISIDRARFKEKLLPGSLELVLSGSGGEVTLTDDSQIVSTTTFVDAGRVFELVSGSLGTVYSGSAQGSGSYANPLGSGSYGKVLPDIGVILLNADILNGTDPANQGGIALGTAETLNTNDNNNRKIVEAIQLGGSNGGGFKLNSEETVSSNFIFVRARNAEFNYSTNPSMITGSGALRHTSMIDSPQSYIGSVGLYNDNNDLLAVAKLSKPLLKDFTKEALVRIKLDY